MTMEPDLDTLLVRLRAAESRGASADELAAIRTQITAAGNREASARQAAQRAQRLAENAPGARLTKAGDRPPAFTPTPEIQKLQQELRAALLDSELAAETEILIALAEPYVRLSTPKDYRMYNAPLELRRFERELGLGASRIGYVPDLPPGIPWPVRDGKKMMFLAQIDFSLVPHWPGSPLPAEGWLYLFADVFGERPPNPWIHQFHYHCGAREALVRQREPVAEDEIWADGSSLTYDIVPVRPRLRLGIDPQFLEQFKPDIYPYDVERVLQKAFRPISDESRQIGSAGYLLGRSEGEATPTEEINHILESEPHRAYENLRQRAASPEGAGDDWIHFLSLRSVGSMSWGDAGVLYFLMRRADLEARRFQEAIMSHICG